MRGLFFNDKQIATTTERFYVDSNTGKRKTGDSASFNYYPSKRLADAIVYSTSEATYAYNIKTGETVTVSDNRVTRLNDIFLTEDKKTIIVEEDNQINNDTSSFMGKVTFDGKTYSNVYSSNYIDGHFYMLRVNDVRDDDSKIKTGKVITYELIRDGKKIENIENNSISIFGYDENAIQQFPFCDLTRTLVCIYEDGHYAYKNRILMPEVFGYDFYTDEMVIDGEYRGDHIPNWIGSSKPIFEDGKLKYIVYTGFPDGLYVVDFDKKWNFKDLYNKKGGATTKLLGGYQNKLLSVMKR